MPFRSSDFLPFKSFTMFVISSEVMGTLAQLKIGILVRKLAFSQNIDPMP